MTTPMTRSLILFLSWAQMAQCRAEGLPTSFTDVLYFINGDLDNFDTAGDENQDRIRVIYKPVSIPRLQKDPVFYMEEIINGKPYRRFVAVKNESSADRILYLTYYNITNPGHFVPGHFNTDELANLTREDLHTHEGCTAFNQKVSPQTLVSDWSDCRRTINGKHPIFGFTATCDDIIFEAPLASKETSALAPYVLKRRGPRFPVISVPEGYVRACPDDQ